MTNDQPSASQPLLPVAERRDQNDDDDPRRPFSWLLFVSLFALLFVAGGGTVLAYKAWLRQWDPPPVGSYWELALETVPPAVTTALRHLDTLTPTSVPDDVRTLRKALLAAREGLDIFSFAYGYTGSFGAGQHADSVDKKAFDTWWVLRHDLDEGYQLVGDFQDLAHSAVDYNSTDAQERLGACLRWLDTMNTNDIRFGYASFVRHIAKGRFVKHKHSSKLFWGYAGVAPVANLTGKQNLVHMVRDAQLAQMLDNYTRVLAFPNVYDELYHDDFHLYRKLARSVLAVLELFPDLLPAQHGGGKPASLGRRMGGRQPVAGDAPLEHAWRSVRCSALGSWLWGEESACRPAGGDLTKKGKKPKPPVGPGACDTAEVLKNLDKMYGLFGDLNDVIIRYDFYMGKNQIAKADAARVEADAQWSSLQAWLTAQKLDTQMKCLGDALADAAASR